jgi:quercetin dioxygenase-like cupin family protein
MTANLNPSASTLSASEATIVRVADAQPREFLGISFVLLATGDRLMVTRMRYQTGMPVAAHHHEDERAGYIISGRYRQTAAGTANELRPGDSYVIPGNVEHPLEVLEGGFVIDVFTPPETTTAEARPATTRRRARRVRGVDEHKEGEAPKPALRHQPNLQPRGFT